MTTPSTPRKAGPFNGNGVAVSFPFTFKIFAASDVKVAIANSAGVETVLVEGTDYTVTPNADQDATPGGKVTYPVSGSPLPAGSVLSIIGDLGYDQPLDLPSGGNFNPLALENQLDRATMQIQQLKEQVDRSAKLPQTSQADADKLSANLMRLAGSAGNIDTVAGSIAAVNIVATNIADIDVVVANLADIQSAPENAALVANAVAQAVDGEKQLFLAGTNYTKGATTQLTLTYTPAKSGTVSVIFDGIEQHLTEWSLVGKVITFTAAIPADKVEVHYHVPSQFVGLSGADLTVLGSAQSAAQASAAASAAQASAATSAKTAAEAARDAAMLSAGVYATTAAGLAATTSGKYFSVPSADSAEYLILYLNNAGVAQEVKRYPAKSALDPLQKTNKAVLAVEDADGNLGLKIQTSFVVDDVGAIDTIAMRQTARSNKWAWAVSDKDGNVAVGVNQSGQLVADFSLVPNSQSLKTGGTYDYEINHVFNYGQSLSVGQATPVISVTQNYDNVMFTRGMRPQYDYPTENNAQWYAALVPAVEAQSPTQSILAETPSMGTGDMIKERILYEDGMAYTAMKYQIALSAPGYGAKPLVELKKGTVHYTRMMDQATYGMSLANAAGKTYAVQAVTWTQGENDYIIDTPSATYLAMLNTFVSDFNSDFKAITGQTKSVPLISYQVASHKVYGKTTPLIALAQADAEETNPLVYIATPMYHFDYAGPSDAHLTSISSRWLGAYYGLAYKRIVIDGQDWKPVKPLSSMKQGAILTVKFNAPSGRLELDTTNVSAATNYGFELVDSVGNLLTISSVSLMGPDTVKVVAASPIPAGAKLRYAWSATGTVGRTDGPRGNLRDTQGYSIVFDKNGINKPMHNWCVIFEIGV